MDDELMQSSQDQDKTKSENFKNWFGDYEKPEKERGVLSKIGQWLFGKGPAEVSAVRNESGPIPVYHGTQAEFDAFDISKANKDALLGPGFYFTEDKEIASSYMEGNALRAEREQGVTKGRVVESWLNIRNPFDADWHLTNFLAKPGAEKMSFDFISDAMQGNAKAVSKLKEMGYDGITHTGGDRVGVKPHRVWIAFEPNQIKSTDNEGTFNPNDPRMRKKDGGDIERDFFSGNYRPGKDVQVFGEPSKATQPVLTEPGEFYVPSEQAQKSEIKPVLESINKGDTPKVAADKGESSGSFTKMLQMLMALQRRLSKAGKVAAAGISMWSALNSPVSTMKDAATSPSKALQVVISQAEGFSQTRKEQNVAPTMSKSGSAGRKEGGSIEPGESSAYETLAKIMRGAAIGLGMWSGMASPVAQMGDEFAPARNLTAPAMPDPLKSLATFGKATSQIRRKPWEEPKKVHDDIQAVGKADGGFIEPVFGEPGRDSEPIKAETGGFIIKASEAQKSDVKPVLESIASTGTVPKFRSGGEVGLTKIDNEIREEKKKLEWNPDGDFSKPLPEMEAEEAAVRKKISDLEYERNRLYEAKYFPWTQYVEPKSQPVPVASFAPPMATVASPEPEPAAEITPEPSALPVARAAQPMTTVANSEPKPSPEAKLEVPEVSTPPVARFAPPAKAAAEPDQEPATSIAPEPSAPPVAKFAAPMAEPSVHHAVPSAARIVTSVYEPAHHTVPRSSSQKKEEQPQWRKDLERIQQDKASRTWREMQQQPLFEPAYKAAKWAEGKGILPKGFVPDIDAKAAKGGNGVAGSPGRMSPGSMEGNPEFLQIMRELIKEVRELKDAMAESSKKKGRDQTSPGPQKPSLASETVKPSSQPSSGAKAADANQDVGNMILAAMKLL